MPTTPNPTSGFLFFVDVKEVTILDITVEEAAKLVISAGLVTPQQLREADAGCCFGRRRHLDAVRRRRQGHAAGQA
jgi:uncharacterized membrane protein